MKEKINKFIGLAKKPGTWANIALKAAVMQMIFWVCFFGWAIIFMPGVRSIPANYLIFIEWHYLLAGNLVPYYGILRNGIDLFSNGVASHLCNLHWLLITAGSAVLSRKSSIKTAAVVFIALGFASIMLVHLVALIFGWEISELELLTP